MARLVRMVLFAIATVIGFARLARAEETPSHPLGEAIEVTDGQCVTRTELLPSVETWLGRREIDRRVRIVVDEVEPGRPRFVVLREGKLAAERRFKPTSIACPDLRAAVALAIALAIDATILQAVLEPEPAREPAPEKPRPVPRARAKPKPAPVPVAARPESSEHPVSAEAALIALVGVLPTPAFGGLLGALIDVDAIAIRAAGWATASSEASIGNGDADVAIVAGELGVCLARVLSALTLRGCVGAAAGAVSATGSGYTVNRAAAMPWLAAAAGLGAELALGGSVSLVSRVAGYVPLARPSLEVNAPNGAALDREEVPPAGVGLSLGAMVEFP